jgi:hypothetical protein
MELDMTGLRISLKIWLLFGLEERRVLCQLPVETEEEREVFPSYLKPLDTAWHRQFSVAS